MDERRQSISTGERGQDGRGARRSGINCLCRLKPLRPAPSYLFAIGKRCAAPQQSPCPHSDPPRLHLTRARLKLHPCGPTRSPPSPPRDKNKTHDAFRRSKIFFAPFGGFRSAPADEVEGRFRRLFHLVCLRARNRRLPHSVRAAQRRNAGADTTFRIGGEKVAEVAGFSTSAETRCGREGF